MRIKVLKELDSQKKISSLRMRQKRIIMNHLLGKVTIIFYRIITLNQRIHKNLSKFKEDKANP